jgi:hypothetical protein
MVLVSCSHLYEYSFHPLVGRTAIDAADWTVTVTASTFSRISAQFIHAWTISLNGVTFANQGVSMSGTPLEGNDVTIYGSSFSEIVSQQSVVDGDVNVDIENSIFVNCSGPYGSVISTHPCPVVINNCTFLNNFASTEGIKSILKLFP